MQGNIAIRIPIGVIFGTTDSEPPEIGDFSILQIVGGQHWEDAETNGIWVKTTGISYYCQSYGRSQTAGDSIIFTTSANANRIGLLDFGGVTSPVCVVEIDGDKTAANNLPTAGDLVTLGVLDSNVLIENGGTLNSTDKLLNQTDPPIDPLYIGVTAFQSWRNVLIADGLQNGVHTLKITNTGYLPSGATSTYVRIYGIYFNDDGATINECPKASFLKNTDSIDSIRSDNNFAFSFTPDGGTTKSWIGHSGSQKFISSNLYLDNVEVTTLTATVFTQKATEIKLVVNARCIHPEVTGDVATYTQEIVFNANTGIKIKTDWVWKVKGTVTGYIPQLGVPDAFNVGATFEGTQEYDLTKSDESMYFNQSGSAAYMFNKANKWGALLSVESYRFSPQGIIQLQDRLGGIMNKMYFLKYQSGSIVEADESFSIIANYRIKKFDDITVLEK